MSLDAYTFIGSQLKPANATAKPVPAADSVAEAWYRQFNGGFPGAVARTEDKAA